MESSSYREFEANYINGNKHVSKLMGRESNLATKYTGMDTEFTLEGQESKDKVLTRLFC